MNVRLAFGWDNRSGVEAIGMMSNYLHMEQMDAAPKLNGAAPRAKFADIQLPSFPRRKSRTA